MANMTDEEYISHEGAKCPLCGGSDTSVGNWQSDSGIVWQDCQCEICGGEWTDEYKLVGYSVNEE